MRNGLIGGGLVALLLVLVVAQFQIRWESLDAIVARARTGDASALSEVIRRAESNNSAAQFKLGLLYLEQPPLDSEDAGRRWIEKAASSGFVDAQLRMGVILENGAKDEAKALFWYEKAASSGRAEGLDALARMLWDGRGGRQDKAKAILLWRSSVSKGMKNACALGRLLEDDHRYPESLWFYKTAADDGDVVAQLKTALLFNGAEGIPRNVEKKLFYLRKAVSGGNADAEYQLASLFEAGTEIERDVDAAMDLYKKAAAQGHEGAIDRIDPRPKLQRAFLKVVVNAQREASAADNNVRKTLIKQQRSESLCTEIFSSGLAASDWIGTINKIDTTLGEKASLELTIAPGVTLKTWNNAVSDALSGQGTLIDRGSSLFRDLARFNIGSRVKFSGRFAQGRRSGECIDELSMSTDGSLSEPEFLFVFASLKEL